MDTANTTADINNTTAAVAVAACSSTSDDVTTPTLPPSTTATSTIPAVTISITSSTSATLPITHLSSSSQSNHDQNDKIIEHNNNNNNNNNNDSIDDYQSKDTATNRSNHRRTKRQRKRPPPSDSFVNESDMTNANMNQNNSNGQIRIIPLDLLPHSHYDRHGTIDTALHTATQNDSTTPARLPTENAMPPLSSSSSSTCLLRIIDPYIHTFTSYCKARWIGRTILDVYITEFGSYPSLYYETAIRQGRIRVSNQSMVSPQYVLQAKDVVYHMVHRHEPAIMVHTTVAPFINIVEETEDLFAIDKPSTIPIHSCGGYHRNSLMNILNETYSNSSNTSNDCEHSNKKFYTIHRLDRLTSGLVVLAKTSHAAQEWGQAIKLRDQCQKIYLARVKGQFGTNLIKTTGSSMIQQNTQSSLPRLPVCCDPIDEQGIPHYGEYICFQEKIGTKVASTNHHPHQHDTDIAAQVSKLRQQYAYGYHISNAITGNVYETEEQMSMNQYQQMEHTIDEWLEHVINRDTSTTTTANTNDGNHETKQCRQPFLWLHVSCPVRVEQPKIGICTAGNFEELDETLYLQTVKSAETRFGIVHYDAISDSTVLIVQPMTGRTHQIRIHLHHVQHSIANDPCYGGTLWFGNPDGQLACTEAKKLLDQYHNSNIDDDKNNNNDTNDATVVTGGINEHLVTTDTPATELEIQQTMQCNDATIGDKEKDDSESILDVIQRTCVWCRRLYGNASTIHSKALVRDGNGNNSDIVARQAKLEFLVRSPGLWLHAFQYKVKERSFRTKVPDWCQF
jgi:23S rRNA-/tRNA-specific pseudouridylate synthase